MGLAKVPAVAAVTEVAMVMRLEAVAAGAAVAVEAMEAMVVVTQPQAVLAPLEKPVRMDLLDRDRMEVAWVLGVNGWRRWNRRLKHTVMGPSSRSSADPVVHWVVLVVSVVLVASVVVIEVAEVGKAVMVVAVAVVAAAAGL